MNRRHLYGLVLALIAIAAGMFLYKWQVLGFPLRPGADTNAWTIEASVSFRAGPGSVRVNLHIPSLTPGYTLLDENFVSRGYGLNTSYVPGGRSAQWAVRRVSGEQTLYYRAVVYEDRSSIDADTTPPFPPEPVLEEPYATALRELVAEVREHSADIETFTAELLKQLNDPSPDQYIDLFLNQVRTPTERAQVATTLLAGARIPARVAHGIYLEDKQRRAGVIPLLEVHNGDEWLYFDPVTGAEGLPDDFLIWWRGSEPLARIEGGGQADVQLAVQHNVIDAMLVAEQRADQRQSRLVEFSLFGLPIQTQSVYSVLLMIPIGAFVMLLMRNVIGISTFGTFMPVLVALAFRETQLIGGIVLFTLIVTLGLMVRFYLEQLRLLLVPRLTSVLIVVVLLMVGVSVFSHRLGLETGLSVALFPMVILAMVIERMSIVWEERGAAEAIKEGLGSLLVAAVAYLVMDIDTLENLVFVYPELLLIVLAGSLLLGRYNGYRLLELIRFRALSKTIG
ncbi:MAG: inactive transglutaminase family protein [Gammaproteobacteria bacterium]|nr:inactive transglutaminase family protein [Gammaproteobacteria bacterium]